MGYLILYDNQILFDPYTDDTVTDASLSFSTNAVSYFDFTISSHHSLYNIIAERAGKIDLFFNDTKLFSGVITEITMDLECNKSVSCSGSFEYLSDTVVRPYSTIDGEEPLTAPSSVDGYFQWLIDQHNQHCLDSSKEFRVGVNQGAMLDSNNYIYRSSEQRPTTASEIEEKILDSLGGYLFVRYDDDSTIIDLYADAHEANTQIIDFGVNITDFSKTIATTDQYTAVVATGYTPDAPEDDPEREMKPITLEGCPDGGTPYPTTVKMGDRVYNIDAVQRYGYREYYASNDDITTYDGLLDYACRVLNTLISPSQSITVKAVDLALYMNNGYDHLQIGQAVRVRSKPHNTDEYLMVNTITLDLEDPGNTEYELGASYDTLTGQQSSYLKSLNANINANLDAVASLGDDVKKTAKEAKEAKVEAGEAKSSADDANTKADEAVKKSDDANSKADETAENVENIKNTVTEVEANSNEAVKNANEAKLAANNAVSEAEKATAIANNANTAANEASTIANVAKTAASDAQAAANKIKADAEAGIAASNAAAEKAQKAADAAQADANANAKAIGVAQATADAAKQAAADAQEKAENVESNLDSTNATVEQHSTQLGELTTKVSNAVTNADAALTASTEAKQTATEASTTATTAYNDAQTAITNSTKATQTATSAKTTSESAVTTANDSLKQASSAVQTANKIQNTLTTDYQTKADSDLLYATKSSLTETSDSIKMEVSQTYATKSTVEALQNVADNAIESWRGSGVPTAENKPASDWITDAEKKRHSGDLYYDKDTGKAYRWGSDDGKVYSWVLNQDTDITKALQDASNAQKSANAAQSTADTAKSNAATAQQTADSAKSDAATAKTAADNAQNSADVAQGEVDQLKIDIPNTYATKASLETTAESITGQVESVSKTANSAVTAASKAQQTADAINVDLTKNYQTKSAADNIYATQASLSATAESISTNVTKAQQTADGAVNAASKAQQTADAVTLDLSKNYQTTKDADTKYATQTSLSATAEGLSTDITKAQTTAEFAVTAANKAQSTADGIQLDLTKNYYTSSQTDSKINNISVGGRNLLVNTNTDNLKCICYYGNGKIEQSSGISETLGTYYNEFTVTKKSTDWCYVGISDPDAIKKAIREGGEYTLSFDVFCDETLNVGNNIIQTGDGLHAALSFGYFKTVAAEWTKVALTGTMNSDVAFNGQIIYISIFKLAENSSIRFSNIKLEKGNRATDWTPAPEDMADKVYTQAQIKASADAITSTVAKTYATKTELGDTNTSISDLKNTVETSYSTKSEVKQLSDQISSTVTEVTTVKNDLSAAQQTADGAVNAASKAQQTADAAKQAAADAQADANEAADNLKIAQDNLAALESRTDVTEADLADAKTAVSNAAKAASDAQIAADTAKANADTAKKTADDAATAASNAQNDVNSLKDRVSSAETSITQNSNAIALRATKTEVTDAVNNISVGGRNLLVGSSFDNLPEVDNTYTKYKNNSVKLTLDNTSGSSTAYARIKSLKQNFTLDDALGKTLTISMWIYIEEIGQCQGYEFRVIYKVGDTTYWDTVDKTYPYNKPKGPNLKVGWNYIYACYTIPNDSTRADFSFTLYAGAGKKSMAWFSSPKCEIGNKPTDWTPSPDDLMTDATTKANNALTESKSYTDAQLKISSDSITSTINSIQDNLSNNYSTTVDMNSTIEQTANAIKQSVSESYQVKGDYATRTEVSSSIEQSASSIQQTVSESYATKDSLTEYVKETRFTQNSDEIRMDFNNILNSASDDIIDRINSADSSTSEMLSNFSKYIRFVNGEIVLGETGNEITLTIENDRVSFNSNGVEVAYFSENRLFIKEASVTHIMKMGNFVWFSRDNGGLNLRKESDW